jgi:hypothetical protein
MNRIRVAIAVDDDALTCVETVAQECRALGFREETAIRVVGVFTGSIERERLAALRAVPGVAAVEVQCRLRIRAPRLRLH